ncbi:disease resistance protein RGA5-like [Juglans regia]|uniref:Disease resistance protein RGA5-like n=1 Tax=Juglans regia TaxID=51240 RepID=A0A2I4F8M1_JUGRE|nr:disease resistance protein RGA5-like [Juglans regia]
MKQKIVVKVQMNCQKCQTKALKVAASIDGVDFLGLGAEKDRVVVIGNGVDAVKLATSLTKKVGHTEIISVEVMKQS